jgi:hypothetical protein
MKPFKIILAPVVFALILQACQKEVSVANRPGITPDSIYHPAGLLMKKVETYLPDNIDWYTTEYGYDSSSRLSSISVTEKIKKSDGSYTTTKVALQFIRDDIGRISNIVSSPAISPVNAIPTYQNASSQNVANICIYKTLTSGEKSLMDSTVFVYNSNGFIAKTSRYERLPGNAAKLQAYQEYLYDNMGNMSEAKLFQDDDNDGTFQIVLTYKWEFNNHSNPEYFNDPGYFYLQEQLFPYSCSPFLVTRQLNHYHYAGGSDDQVSYTFQYDSLDRLILTKKDGDADNETRYYYY